MNATKPVEIMPMLYGHIDETTDLDMICCADSPHQRWSRHQLDKIVTDMACHKLVAVQNGRVIGYAVRRDMRQSARLVRVGVDPRYRRRGIASRLVARLTTGVPMLRATAIDTETEFHLFLKDCGFRAVEVIHGERPGARDIYAFERPLGVPLPALARA